MSYLSHVRACNTWDPDHFRPFRVNDATVGMLRHGFAEHLRRWPEVFRVGDQVVRLAPELTGFEARTAALRQVLGELVQEGSVSHFHGEIYPMTPGSREEAVCVIDRAAAPYFGTRAFGQHVNGFVRGRNGIKMWVARRALDRRQFPGKLDNMTAGGLPQSITLGDNLAKELQEEAGVTAEDAARAQPVGALTYIRETGKGLKPDTIYCYDLELPEDFRPVCTDGEVDTFHLWPLQQVAEVVRASDEFKLNCNLVVIDFLIRHGFLGPEHEEYLALTQELHAPLRHDRVAVD
jgi:8-oxo-dGTP pyrophosphatase MutT (NUDIX family)